MWAGEEVQDPSWASRSKKFKIFPLYIVNASNRGFADGNNIGVASSGSELVVLLNPDAVMEERYCLREIANGFIQRSDMGILGAKLLRDDRWTLDHCGGRIGVPAHGHLFGHGEIDNGQWDEVREVEYVMGALLATRRRIWDRLGGFDEYFNPIYYEDVDLCLRCRRLGSQVLYWPVESPSREALVPGPVIG